MYDVEILMDCVILLQRELLKEKKLSNISISLVKTILNNLRIQKPKVGLTTDPVIILHNLINSMLDNPGNYITNIKIITELKINLPKDSVYLEIILGNIEPSEDVDKERKHIEGLRTNIINANKKIQTINMISEVSRKISTQKQTDEAIFKLGMELKNKLDNLSISSGDDPGTVGVLDLNNENSVSQALDILRSDNSDTGILKTGWWKLNKCIQGGFRRGEMTCVYALQHNYKSGFMQSVFAQIARHNKPVLVDPNKKPLLLYISLEDELKNILNFLYKYLYANENGKAPTGDDSIFRKPATEIFKYINDRLSVNGFKTVIRRVNPSEWNYLSLIKLLDKYKAQGYEVQLCIVDYLSKLPTDYCNKSGPTGTDVRDMFDKVRNYISKERITFLTPHQLSTGAKALLKQNVPEAQLVNEIANKGFTEGTGQLDQILDLELNIHIANINKVPHLTVRRGKHRGTDIIDPKNLYFTLKFPPLLPIPEDLEEKDEPMDDGVDVDALQDLFGV